MTEINAVTLNRGQVVDEPCTASVSRLSSYTREIHESGEESSPLGEEGIGGGIE